MGAEATATQATSAAFLDDVILRARGRARARVAALRAKHFGESRSALAQRLVKSFSRRAGLGGAATGALSLLSLPVGLPAGVALTLTIEAELLLALLEVYGLDSAGAAGRLKLYTLWAGGGLADAAKSAGLALGTDAVALMLSGTLPARLVARLNPALVRVVLRRLGLGWVPRALRFWPVLGAPIGYVVDASVLSALGRAAIHTLDSAADAPVATLRTQPDVSGCG